ncbi:SET domain-containing protein [Amylocystis lapponica]|nr:SET domain-containing protein [Amylocystis lapponica]
MAKDLIEDVEGEQCWMHRGTRLEQDVGHGRTLTDWCAHHAIRLAHSIHLAAHPDTGLAVFSHSHVHPSSTLVLIPKAALLSVRSCSLAPHIPFAPVGHPAELSLALALYAEILRGPESKWHGYIQSLPPQVPIALFWGVGEACPADEDGVEARMWIAGTEVERELHANVQDGTTRLDEVYAYYAAVVRPLLSEFSLPGSLAGYMHAYALVSSRAFLVDAYHGLAMVPIADAFNHANANHVHLASDYDVCPTCGSLDECPHDRDDIPARDPAPAPLPAPLPTADTCDMVAVRPIAPSDEVFNTYGAQLGNAALLARYGFALEANEHDVVSWAPDGLDAELGGRAVGEAELARLMVGRWTLLLEDSMLVYRPDLAEDGMQKAGRDLCVNGDAQVSVRLWLRVVLHAVSAEGQGTAPDLAGGDALARFVGQVAEEQMCVERMIAAGDDSVPEEAGDGDMRSRRTLARVAYAIQALCAQRLARIGKHPEMSVLTLGELLDGLPADRPKTRLALAQVLAERAILESCVAAWQEVELMSNPGGEDMVVER